MYTNSPCHLLQSGEPAKGQNPSGTKHAKYKLVTNI